MVALGQFGSDYVDKNESATVPAGMDILAIQFVGGDDTGTSLSTMTVAEDSGCFTKTGTKFPNGLTVFGRWTAVSVTNDGTMAAVVYFGPKL